MRELWTDSPFLCECCGEQTIIKPVSAVGNLSIKTRVLTESTIRAIYRILLNNILDKDDKNPRAFCGRSVYPGANVVSLYIVRLSETEFTTPFCRACLVKYIENDVHITGADCKSEIYEVATTPRALKQLLVNYENVEADLGIKIDPSVQLF